MPKFFVPHENICENTVQIYESDAAHIVRVLRMHEGEQITLCDGAGMDYTGEICNANPEEVTVSILEKHFCEAEPSVSITLFMALPKSDKMDYVIQKSVELGVQRIIPFAASRCVVKLSEKDAVKKTERWQKIAHAAAKQCGRGIVPEVCQPIRMKELCTMGTQFDLPLFCYECEEQQTLKSVLSEKPFQTVCIVVGPEGGFTQEEVQQVGHAGFRIVSLGKRILRCETAPGCAICAILYHTDNL